MLLVQHLLGALQIESIFRFLRPRHLQHRVEMSAQNGVVR